MKDSVQKYSKQNLRNKENITHNRKSQTKNKKTRDVTITIKFIVKSISLIFRLIIIIIFTQGPSCRREKTGQIRIQQKSLSLLSLKADEYFLTLSIDIFIFYLIYSIHIKIFLISILGICPSCLHIYQQECWYYLTSILFIFYLYRSCEHWENPYKDD